MVPTKTRTANATPNTSGSSQQKRLPATKVKNKDSATSIVGSGDGESSARRPQSMPTNVWGPGGAPGWKPRKKVTDTADAGKNTRNSRPASSVGAKGVTPRAAHAPEKIPARRERPVPSSPKPEEVPLGVAVKMERNTVEAVERQTRGQSQNPKWFSWRQNRITASIAHQVSHSRFANGHSNAPPVSYLTAITGQKRGIKTRAMAWGIENEARAAQEYQQLKSQSLGRPVRVQECGLFIDPERAWLAASPDGIVEDAESGEPLLCLEIKCPYKHRDHTVAEACTEDRHFCLELQPNAGAGGSRYRLKTKHNYYTQVQCQMAVMGLHKADFVVFTLHEVAIVPVTFDPLFWESTLAKMEIFYKDAVLPYLKKKGRGFPLQRREE
ncbi:hypothetical protein SKAU_G00081290 [Synaphobranchus kaupii]|uniref:YqaJ viral recombinase domain-containing protein n=1 Tax=Synaphobranchus kaupii TaxID=118154 RepID=A0A9Q1J5I7_SYNKA|nr:hypothetical protein SKAU_G00081290 [Synaphobranchus kaupii]